MSTREALSYCIAHRATILVTLDIQNMSYKEIMAPTLNGSCINWSPVIETCAGNLHALHVLQCSWILNLFRGSIQNKIKSALNSKVRGHFVWYWFLAV